MLVLNISNLKLHDHGSQQCVENNGSAFSVKLDVTMYCEYIEMLSEM